MKPSKPISNKIFQYLTNDIWKTQRANLPRLQAFFVKQLQILLIARKGFKQDACMLRSSALTFFSLVSIVPVFAMVFGIAQGFGLEQLLERQLRSSLEGQEEVLTRILAFSHSLLQHTKGGLIAGIGVVLLFWSVLKVLSNVEEAFNAIWHIQIGRSWGRKLNEYLSIILIAPVMLILSSSMAVIIETQVTHVTQSIRILGYAAPFIFFLLNLLPYLLQSMLFTFIYIVMPNTKVRIKSAVAAGIIAGVVFQVTQWIYITFQVGVVSYNAIYGSFAAFPLFLAWLNTSWVIVLLGAEISYASQHYDEKLVAMQGSKEPLNEYSYKLNALVITHSLVKNFAEGKPAINASQITKQLHLSPYTVDNSLAQLVKAHVISISSDELERTYQPAVDTDLITITYVLQALSQLGLSEKPVHSESYEVLNAALLHFQEYMQTAHENKRLKDIA